MKTADFLIIVLKAVALTIITAGAISLIVGIATGEINTNYLNN
jgi:hypothetical protein